MAGKMVEFPANGGKTAGYMATPAAAYHIGITPAAHSRRIAEARGLVFPLRARAVPAPPPREGIGGVFRDPPRAYPAAAAACALRCFLASLPVGSAALSLPFFFSLGASGRSTNSRIAIGAPSPWRKPVRMIRV